MQGLLSSSQDQQPAWEHRPQQWDGKALGRCLQRFLLAFTSMTLSTLALLVSENMPSSFKETAAAGPINIHANTRTRPICINPTDTILPRQQTTEPLLVTGPEAGLQHHFQHAALHEHGCCYFYIWSQAILSKNLLKKTPQGNLIL